MYQFQVLLTKMRASIAICLLLACLSTASALPLPLTRKLMSNTVQSLSNITLTASSNAFTCEDALYDCNNHGFCSKDKTDCICDSQYASYDCDNTRCCYKKENRIKMFLLSFFVSWLGVPFFILGATGLGVGMIMLCCGGCTLAGIGMGIGARDDNACGMCLAVVGILAFLAAIFWSLAIWIMFAAETEPWHDANGIPVGPWP
jgi:hypothetical protein